jgi:hypothetical protein
LSAIATGRTLAKEGLPPGAGYLRRKWVKALAKRLVNYLGLEIRRIDRASAKPIEKATFILYRYVRPDGSFDYQRYREIQTSANKQKLECAWAQEENIDFLSSYILRTIGRPKFGLCHGTRRGVEQEWFRKTLACEVIGTEISETANEFPNTIQWDFHHVKPEWIDSVDFIYSNSFDHTYDPEKCLNAWMSCVRPGGLCILEHSSLHSPEGANEVDPFGADIVYMPYLILTWGKGNYGVRDLLEAPKHPTTFAVRYEYFIVIQRH